MTTRRHLENSPLRLAETIRSIARKSRQIVLDFDATDDPLHGTQQGHFFHGCYGRYCYLPLCTVFADIFRCWCGPSYTTSCNAQIDSLHGLKLFTKNVHFERISKSLI